MTDVEQLPIDAIGLPAGRPIASIGNCSTSVIQFILQKGL